MPLPFSDLRGRLSEAVDGQYAISFRFIPETAVDNWGKPTGEERRGETILTGSLIDGDPDIEFTDGDRRISDFNGRAARSDVHATFDRAQFGNVLPKKDDRLEAVTKFGNRMFKIVAVRPNGNRIVCALVRA